MVSPARTVRATTGATLFLCACTLYSPELLTSSQEGGGGASGAAGATNPCNTGSKCAEGGVSGAGGSSGAAGSAGTAGDVADVSVLPSAPYIRSTTTAPFTTVGLSSEGSLDWAHWGLAKASDYNHKNLPNPLLWTLATVGIRPITRYTGDRTNFVWTDGTPTTSAMSDSGVSVAGVGEGFVVTAPASSDARLLRLYVGVQGGTAQMQAKFSDPAAADSTLTDVLTSQGAMWYAQIIEVEYLDGAPGTTISVAWKVQSGEDAGVPAVHIKAVTLARK